MTKPDLMECFADLREVYRMPDETTLERLANVWYGVLSDLTAEAVQEAVRSYLSGTARWWPKPGHIRSLVLDRRKDDAYVPRVGLEAAFWKWWRDGGMSDGEPCPVCGSALEERYRRMNVWHDPQRHREAGVPIIGRRADETPPVRRKRESHG